MRSRPGRESSVCGLDSPTGSGKTTTLQGALADLNLSELNVVTVDDPVEYVIDGIKQMQVNRRAGLTIPSALRSILRADPDVVLIGEVRDGETLKLAAEAALTGHLVLASLHTNDAASTPLRLLEMGLEPFVLSAALDSVVAQRLMRRLCDQCKEMHPVSALASRGLAGIDRAAARRRAVVQTGGLQRVRRNRFSWSLRGT